MDWLKNRYETGIEALTTKRSLYIGSIIAAATLAATYLPQIKWKGEPMFLDVSTWTWWVIAACMMLVVIVFEYAHRTRMKLVPKIEAAFDSMADVVQTPEHSGTQTIIGESNATYINITANALSSTTVRECSAFLTGIKKRGKDGQFVTIPVPSLITLGDNFSISHKVPRVISILRVSERDNVLQPAVPWPLILRGVFAEHTTYRIKVVVVAGGISHEIEVDVVWVGRWDAIAATRVK